MAERQFPQGAAIVFGGSGGIGQGVARAFGRAGADVAICYRSKREAAEGVADEIRGLGVKASVHQLDVRDPAQLEAVVATAGAEHGRLHSAVWGAGPLVPQLYISELTLEHYRNAIDVEVLGFFNAVQALLPHFRAHGGGSFVHLGSAGHDLWPPKDALSVAPKAANEALVRGLAKEEGKHEIRANSVLVGVIDAGQFKVGQKEGYFDAEWERNVKAMLPIKRWGKAEDIGKAAVFLASDDANYVTGQTISVAGGFGV